MSASRAATLVWTPRRMSLSMISPKNRSTWLTQDDPVGVKWMWNRGWRASHVLIMSVLVSSRRGFHPPALPEPYVTVSRHTAPTGRPAGGVRRYQWANSLG